MYVPVSLQSKSGNEFVIKVCMCVAKSRDMVLQLGGGAIRMNSVLSFTQSLAVSLILYLLGFSHNDQ